MLRVLGAAIVAGLVLSASTAAGAEAPALHWLSAPQSGTHILLDTPPRTLRLAAVARDRRERVTFSLLGRTPVRLVVRSGNLGRATLHFPAPRDFQPRTFVVTVVARTVRNRSVAIARTLIVEVRATTVSLVGPGAVARWAYVTRATVARTRPSRRARPVASVATTTSDATPNLVRVFAETRSRWVQVALTTLPNGRTGWVPRSVLSHFHTVSARIVVDTRRLTLSLYRQGKLVLRVPVAVGRSQWPTPRGTFYIRDRLTHFQNPFYGPIAFGTNARSPTLTDWPGGGIVGIHGTNAPGLIPGRVSHGCIRLRNADILRLARVLPLGAPVVVR